MIKEIRKEIIKRSKLKNKYNKKRNYENWSLYKKQRNYCLSLWRKTKTAYFEKLNIEKLVIIKHFGKLSGHISVIKTINLLILHLLETILSQRIEKELKNQ